MTRLGMLGLLGFPWIVRTRARSRRGWETAKRVELPRHGQVEIALSLDVVGDSCLRTNLLTKKVLDHARPGEVVEIVSDNLSSVETIPFMLANYRCVHLHTCREAQNWRIYVRKEPAGAGTQPKQEQTNG